MKEIRLFDVELYIDGDTFHYEDNQWMEDIHIPKQMRTDLLRHLICFHTADLTEAYHGHTVVVRLVEPKE